MTTMTQSTHSFDAEMSLFAPATNVIKALAQLMRGEYTPVAKINTLDADEAFARMLQEQDDADFARALQAIEEQEANDAAIAKLLQGNEDEAFARMIQEQEDADFTFALSLQFEEADMLGASASYSGLGSLGQDYYNAFYAA